MPRAPAIGRAPRCGAEYARDVRHDGRCLMARTAVARSPRHDDEATMTHVDELIQRGRGQGHLSLPELRAAFGQAGIAATEARSILRELSEAGVRLGNDPDGQPLPAGATADPADQADGNDQADG